MPLIFKTDIKTKKNVKALALLLNNDATIIDWSVDLQDIDNVLRIAPTHGLSEHDVIAKVRALGFYCEPLDA